MQIATDDRLRFVPFRHFDRGDAPLGADPRIEACEVDELGSEAQRLRDDRVVVPLFGEMSIAAGFCLGLTLCMRIVRIHRLRAVT